ncbi:MAG: hypothetical protein ABI461_19550 [Polyangiaceae bacterium]
MKASWKFLAFAGGLALAATAGAACTVTSGNGDDDAGDLFTDAGGSKDTGAVTDTGTTPDTGSTTGCTSLTEVDPDGGSFGITFADDGGSACDNCLKQNCCTEFNGCFQESSGECQGLNGCIQACVDAPDAGGCNQDCQEAYNAPATTDAFNAFTSCYGAHCSSVCPQ